MIRLNLPPATQRHTEERLKLIASGLQLLALALLGAGLIAPFFNSAITDPTWMKMSAVIAAGLCESVALLILGYIPFPTTP